MDSPAAGRILAGIDAKLDAKGLAAESGIRRVQYSTVRASGLKLNDAQVPALPNYLPTLVVAYRVKGGVVAVEMRGLRDHSRLLLIQL